MEKLFAQACKKPKKAYKQNKVDSSEQNDIEVKK